MFRIISKLARPRQTNCQSSLQMRMQLFWHDLFTHADKLHRHRNELSDFKRQQVFDRFFYHSIHVDYRILLGWAFKEEEIKVLFLLMTYLWEVERALR